MQTHMQEREALLQENVLREQQARAEIERQANDMVRGANEEIATLKVAL